MSQPPKPTEAIYPSRPAIFPALLAVGLAALFVGLFAWWPYAAIGGVIALVSLIGWLRATRDDIARMPRHQHTDTAPIPLSVPVSPDE